MPTAMTPFLLERATVYTEGASGAFDTVVATNVPCRLFTRRTAPFTVGLERSELDHTRAFVWDAAALPLADEHVQIAVGTTRWNVLAGSLYDPKGQGGRTEYGRLDVVRAL